MKTIIFTIVITTLVNLAAINFANAAEKPMNILMLTVDDMNCDSVGVFGCKVPQTTPNIDRLAADSLRFNHAHVHASSCVPSRNIVMTGRYLYNSGVEGFYAVPPKIQQNPTIPEFLKKNGYFVMIQGKANHSMPYAPFPAWDIDFDDGQMRGHNTRHPKTVFEFTKKGIEAAKKAGKPFFYNINIHDPHLALYNWSRKKGEALNRQDRDNPPSRIYKPDEVVVPGFLPDTPLVRKELAAYYSTVRRSDDSVGQVIRSLKEAGVYDNTIIIFFSDHGMPFPFAKTAMYYHSTHTPLIVRCPQITKPGTVDDEHVLGTIDLFPTIVELLGLQGPDKLDGRSFADLLHGKSQKNRDFVYTMYEENVGGNRQPTRSVISKDFGYIVNLWSDGTRKFATATRGMASTHEIKRLAKAGNKSMQQRLALFEHRVPEEFYHYKKDLDALNNLIDDSQYAEKIKSFRKQAMAFMKATDDPLLKIYNQRDDEKAVQAYLNQLDNESKQRKNKPEIYKRNYFKKKTKEKQQKKLTEEQKRRAKQRRQQRLKKKQAA